jgi:hypothetical protein
MENNGSKLGIKKFNVYNIGTKFINNWITTYIIKSSSEIGVLNIRGNDFQQQNIIFIANKQNSSSALTHIGINQYNLMVCSIYFSVRHCIPADWLNDRDQFLYPSDEWQTDTEFQNDCLAYTLFNNNIQSKYGTNHWIPFTETEVNSRGKFASSFMTDFIKGKLKQERVGVEQIEMKILDKKKSRKTALQFSTEAQAVFEAGKKLWKYYHAQPKSNPNASFYDIREHFQGRNAKGTMNSKSEDEKYNELIGGLRSALDVLAKKIEPKVYEYGFLRG